MNNRQLHILMLLYDTNTLIAPLHIKFISYQLRIGPHLHRMYTFKLSKQWHLKWRTNWIRRRPKEMSSQVITSTLHSQTIIEVHQILWWMHPSHSLIPLKANGGPNTQTLRAIYHLVLWLRLFQLLEINLYKNQL